MAPERALEAPRLDELVRLDLPLDGDDLGACCAALYEHPGVRWLLGGELHPGGETTTRRALELIGVGAGNRLLDVACGPGASVLLAARERGCEAVGIDRGESALAGARDAARAEGPSSRVEFELADAEALPFPDGSFDAVLCECSLSTFSDKERAAAEMRRVLTPDGRAAISDVVVDAARLPEALREPVATIACVGDALDAGGYSRVLRRAGLAVTGIEPHDRAAARLAARVEDRLRGARVLGLSGLDRMVELAGLARGAIEDGVLGYSILTAAPE